MARERAGELWDSLASYEKFMTTLETPTGYQIDTGYPIYLSMIAHYLSLFE